MWGFRDGACAIQAQTPVSIRIANLHPQQQQHAESDPGGDGSDGDDDGDGVGGCSIMSSEDDGSL